MTDPVANTTPTPKPELQMGDIMNLLIAAKAALPHINDEHLEAVSASIARVRKVLVVQQAEQAKPKERPVTETPGKAFPVIGDTSTVRFKLGTLIGFIVTLLGGCWWLSNLSFTVNELKQTQAANAKTLDHMERQIDEIHSIYFRNPSTNAKVSVNP
jgi:hypothetical protein